MFTNASGCELVGTGYMHTAKHRRLTLDLLPTDGPQFRVAFNDIAAYRVDRAHYGKVIVSVKAVPLAHLISTDWDRIIAADISGMWPGPMPADSAAASAFASAAALQGFRIAFDSAPHAWAISRDFVLLGQLSNYPHLKRK